MVDGLTGQEVFVDGQRTFEEADVVVPGSRREWIARWWFGFEMTIVEADSYGRLQALINENGERYHFAWDAGDRLVEQQDLDGSAKRYDYDTLDNVTVVEHVAWQR